MIDLPTVGVAVLLVIFLAWCAFHDVKHRYVPVDKFNAVLLVLYACIVLLFCVNGWVLIPIITAVTLPFLLWFFSKGKYGAIDARLMMVILLIIPSLYWQIAYLIGLVTFTLIMWLITKFITKTYDIVSEAGEPKYIPQVVSILLAFVFTFVIWMFIL